MENDSQISERQDQKAWKTSSGFNKSAVSIFTSSKKDKILQTKNRIDNIGGTGTDMTNSNIIANPIKKEDVANSLSKTQRRDRRNTRDKKDNK